MPDEIKTPPIIIYPDHHLSNGTDENVYAFGQDHTISDALRWLVSESDKDEVRTCLELLDE